MLQNSQTLSKSMNSALQACDIFLWKTERVVYNSEVRSGSGESKGEEGSATGGGQKQAHGPSRSSGRSTKPPSRLY